MSIIQNHLSCHLKNRIYSKAAGYPRKNGTFITLPFAHTLEYVGGNRFIANCEDGKFGLCEVKYHGQVESDCGVENIYGWFPEFLLEGYDFVVCLGKGYYEFEKKVLRLLSIMPMTEL